MGDPRRGVGLRADGLPDIEWVEIPAGEFLMGINKAKVSRDEMPQQLIYLDTFQISRYPVTYSQYASFVEDCGYENDSYWTRDGLRWRGNRCQPEAYWNDAKWHIANHPVVGVTWYEAYAFTRWLSVKLGQDIALPNAAQWEKAARGLDERIYPYGNEFDVTKSNMRETGIDRTCAVGIFPNGASPYGVLDMSGNVWDWCMTKWRKDYLTLEDNDPQGGDWRMVRGGSWRSNRNRAHTVFLNNNSPIGKDFYAGFRLVRTVRS